MNGYKTLISKRLHSWILSNNKYNLILDKQPSTSLCHKACVFCILSTGWPHHPVLSRCGLQRPCQEGRWYFLLWESSLLQGDLGHLTPVKTWTVPPVKHSIQKTCHYCHVSLANFWSLKIVYKRQMRGWRAGSVPKSSAWLGGGGASL